MKHPKISIIHPTARLPHGWYPSFSTWNARAEKPEDIEYLLVIDEGMPEPNLPVNDTRFSGTHLLINRGAKSSVAAANLGAQLSGGDLLILAQDDLYPPQNWDTQILNALGDKLYQDAVIRCKTGMPRDNDLLFVLNMTRTRYKRLGYMFYPDYISMYADDDLTQHAMYDNVIVSALDIKFYHHHWTTTGAEEDETYRWQNRPEAAIKGQKVFQARKERNYAA